MAGRPRDVELERRLLSAAWSLLTSQGYDALALTQVAVQAAAHRSDVYRRWPSKARLVVDALAEHLPPTSAVDTGSLYSDLRAFVDDLAAAWSSPGVDGLVGLLADLRRDPDALAAYRTWGTRRDQPLVDAIARAVRRGEIGTAGELVLVGNVVEGPLMHRRMFARQPFTPDFLDAVAQSAHRLLTATVVTT